MTPEEELAKRMVDLATAIVDAIHENAQGMDKRLIMATVGSVLGAMCLSLGDPLASFTTAVETACEVLADYSTDGEKKRKDGDGQ